MRQVLVLIVVSAGLALGTGSHPAAACSCVEVDSETRLAEADVVFTGTFEETAHDGDQRNAHRFTVDRVYKGGTATATVLTSADSTDACGAEFVAARYLVYAHRTAPGDGDGDDLTTSLCSGNIRLADDSDLPGGLGAGAEPDESAPPASDDTDTTSQPGRGVGGRGFRPLPVALAGAVAAVAMLTVSLLRHRRRHR